ncbi:HAMP domain-containing histidine kinase [Allokutzneria sp. A3M-2-11 16]|uniref:sensor histidine kinase n=1 Tax=Allokutzneria sp. A3M-2-11 16 TaxID=2962043 RepID=UPI0020B6D145|nr:HAMP domain-containing sensor histidine kinase [Allokutzneria sp. A3M-2-11 16]MCP3802207.1 HAMP domain-containing histidine kinase [Allokutzneria sp. A3M-2-11 16]
MVRQLVASYVLLIALAIAGFTVPVAFTLTAQLEGDLELSVRREADTVALLLAAGDEPSRQALDRLVRAYEQQTPGRIELLPAAAATDSTAWQYSPALGADALVVTVPASSPDGAVKGAVRVSFPDAPLEQRLWQIWGFRAALAIGVLVLAAAAGVFVARRLTRPLRELTAMAARFGDGDLTARSVEAGPPETRTLSRTLNAGAERIGTLVDAQRAFVADASHQLRTPLTALRLSLDNISDALADNNTDDEFTREDVAAATAEVVRMSRLVNGLLALAKAEGMVAPPEPTEVADLVRDRFEVWSPVAAERGVRLVAELPDEDLRVLAGPGHLEQVLDNVLSNALDVSPEGGMITVRAGAAGDRVDLAVLDQGPGLSEQDRARAFDRFWRGPALTGRGGSGLGLAIVKQLVADSAGSARLEAAPGGGLGVWISLRAATSPASPRSGG